MKLFVLEIIFLETSLEDMATMYPTSMPELEKISGVSKGKAIRYGKPFLDVISAYVEENDIIRPDDFIMKSVVNKNNNKIKYYKSYTQDKKLSISHFKIQLHIHRWPKKTDQEYTLKFYNKY